MALAAPSAVVTRARRSTSAVSYSDSEARDVGAQLDKISHLARGSGGSAADAIQAAQALRQLVTDSATPHRLRDAFRTHRGFSAVLDMQRWATAQAATATGSDQQLLALHAGFELLSVMLRDHWGNQRFFRTKVASEANGGWEALREALQTLLEKKVDSREKVLGWLLACALDDYSLDDIFLRLGHASGSSELSPDLVHSCETALASALGRNAFLHNPEAALLLFKLWRSDPSTSDAATMFVPTVVRLVGEMSAHALAGLHQTNLLTDVLPALELDLIECALNEVKKLALSLLRVGVSNVGDAKDLFRAARHNTVAADTLRDALVSDSVPPSFYFDLGLHGYSSIELPDLGRTFPPITQSSGYTLSMWFQVTHFDTELHTTLFGAFDPSQTCFVLVYLEKDTKNLILQTSVTAPRPSVRFKGFTFEQGRWYHLCIVHRRPGHTTASKALLFVDGEFVEQAKVQYPVPPPIEGERRAVQAFLGTPQDLATKPGKGTSSLRWQLASAHLFSETLSDDLIAVYKELGPRYEGNYQDCLGSFQTYRASASLNLRNETIHPGKEEKSVIVAAIRSKAGALVSEHRILLNIDPTNTFGYKCRTAIESTTLIRNLCKRSAYNLHDATRSGHNPIAINGALPSVNDALLHRSGIAMLTGEPAVINLPALDDACWSIGGCCAVCLAMLDAAETKPDILRALEIIFGTIRHSWRNSEAMERENGFGVLSSLLTAKLQQMAQLGRQHRGFTSVSNPETGDFLMSVLNLILEFVGYDAAAPENSVINNPLAYRILLVDLDIWRSAPNKVQQLYYEQFSTFGIGSKYHVFNAKRLGRMRIVKRWLEALKGENFYAESMDSFLRAFKGLLTISLSAETLRALALYITFALNRPKESLAAKKSLRNLKVDGPRRSSTTVMSSVPASGDRSERPLTRAEVGTKVLELYANILCEHDAALVKKFAKTVTNRWLLFLLADIDPLVVVTATRILARVLIANGPGYIEKFTEKTGGFVIMRDRLRKWWRRPELWVLCFSILLGYDMAKLDLNRSLDVHGLLQTFKPADVKIIHADTTPVIVAMLQAGLKFIMQGMQDTPVAAKDDQMTPLVVPTDTRRRRSTSLANGGEKAIKGSDPLGGAVKTVQTMMRFLSEMHANSPRFRDFAVGNTYVQELLFLLFPVVVGSDVVSPDMEINYRGSMNFQGNDVVMRPLSQHASKAAPIVRTSTVEASGSSQIQPLRRGSSFVLVTSEESRHQPSSARLEPIASPKQKTRIAIPDSHALIEDILEIVVAVFTEQILHRKDFQGIGLFMKVPPGFQEHQAYFETYILRNLVSSLTNTIKLNMKLLWETRVITNLGRFCHHLDEAVYEGWFIDGADTVLDFIGTLLEYFQQPDVKNLKSTRLCSEIIVNMRVVMARVVLLRMSEYDGSQDHEQTVGILTKLMYWHTVLFVENGFTEETLRLFCYLLYTNLVSIDEAVQDSAVNLWRLLMVQKPEQVATMLHRLIDASGDSLSNGLQRVVKLENMKFISWIDDHRAELDAMFFGKLSQVWESFVGYENRRTQDSFKFRVAKRREKLKIWASEESSRDEIIRKHDLGSEQWRANIYSAEQLKRQRSAQDQQDSIAFNFSSWTKMQKLLRRPFGLLADEDLHRWQLDLTEGRNRMRMRLIPDRNSNVSNYQSKIAKLNRANTLALETRSKSVTPIRSPVQSPIDGPDIKGKDMALKDLPMKELNAAAVNEETGGPEVIEEDDDFEMVEEPETEQFEDKNRKVMRSLQRGDQVEHVHNISRVIGLEATEGLLIVGKMALYLIDNFFQRSDGEIVDAAQAPPEERDSYLQMISGRKNTDTVSKRNPVAHETRSWRWEDILSISKRRFLFRDVAIEVFFVDGRSYLLTIHNPQLRNDLYQRLMSRAQSVNGGINSPHPEDQWRIESLRTPEDNPQTLGSRFTNVFAQGITNPATRKWVKGEISNFHYLMLVNTMAGRTFNDLTQYPVFPWVLADYTSEELDLTNPRVFRDLSKPMGCQTLERQAEFRERYQSFAEMGDQPPFHYGTHYSSAMIVTSYLIRLQPFVQSYLLLQGGVFDHPDRLFYSIERAWSSASRDNMTDVRELIPEFYYLPEMFMNLNGFDFGERQGDGGRIDNVTLPPWAKGDPKIFVAKHREALESPYVSQHLQRWIDLVFGQKQRGEAAIEATNVFHHLSYRGAKNLDEIDDPVERMATIGIIHNFGQTPHQVFTRMHPQRDDAAVPSRLDSLAETLTRVPFTLLETNEHISSILYSPRTDRLLCSGPFRLHLPPNFDKYMEWGFVDGSVRFFSAAGAAPSNGANGSAQAANKPALALFEHMHQGQLTAAVFVDSRTLVTAGTDCIVSVWSVVGGAGSNKILDLVPRGNLFGHEQPATILAASRAFSTLLSATPSGQVLLWDLNRLTLIRSITAPPDVTCAAIGDVTGRILICAGPRVAVYSINGELLLDQHACAEGDEMVGACALYEGGGAVGAAWTSRELVLTGHRRGVVNVWGLVVVGSRWGLELVKRLVGDEGRDRSTSAGAGAIESAGRDRSASRGPHSRVSGTVTSILALDHAVYTGDSEGRVVSCETSGEKDSADQGSTSGTAFNETRDDDGNSRFDASHAYERQPSAEALSARLTGTCSHALHWAFGMDALAGHMTNVPLVK